MKSKLGEFKQSKNVILAILEVKNFDFCQFEQLSSPKFKVLKWPKMTFLDRLNWPKYDFTQNQSDSKIIKCQQSQALTSHFECIWSIVHTGPNKYVSILAVKNGNIFK